MDFAVPNCDFKQEVKLLSNLNQLNTIYMEWLYVYFCLDKFNT